MKRWQLGFTMIGLIALMLFFGGCSALPDAFYRAPYPEFLLKKADRWIATIDYLPDEELQIKCAWTEPVSGCSKLLTGKIYILDDYGPAFKYCVLQHERSHFYEMHVLQLPVTDTQAHKGWIQPECYKPQAGGRTEILATIQL